MTNPTTLTPPTRSGPVRLRYSATLDIDVDLHTGQVVGVTVPEAGITRDRKHRATRTTPDGGRLACPPAIATHAVHVADHEDWPVWTFTPDTKAA